MCWFANDLEDKKSDKKRTNQNYNKNNSSNWISYNLIRFLWLLENRSSIFVFENTWNWDIFSAGIRRLESMSRLCLKSGSFSYCVRNCETRFDEVMLRFVRILNPMRKKNWIVFYRFNRKHNATENMGHWERKLAPIIP